MVLAFLACLLCAGWFEQIAITFPIAGHGACEIDQVFGVAKNLLRQKVHSSLLAVREVLAGNKINLREITQVIDAHLLRE